MTGREDIQFLCQSCGNPVKPVAFRGEYVHLRRMLAMGREKFGQELCFPCYFKRAREQMEAGSSELCKTCVWNTYEFPDRKCPNRTEAERAGMMENTIRYCTDYMEMNRRKQAW